MSNFSNSHRNFIVMKTLLLFLVSCCVNEIRTEMSCGTGTLPGGLKSLENCCKVPILFNDSTVLNCERFCMKNKLTAVDCVQECLIMTHIERKGVLNLTAIEALYSQASSKCWENVTRAGLQKCVLDTRKSEKNYKVALEKFEDCMNFHFEDNCMDFHDLLECDRVEEFMENCLNTAPTCNEWPYWIVYYPENCCVNMPYLFDDETITMAYFYCDYLNITTYADKLVCMSHFLLSANMSSIRVNKTWHFETAKDIIMYNDLTDSRYWKEIIENTMKKCENQVHGNMSSKIFIF